MPKIQYGSAVKLGKATLNIIERANMIINEYSEQGYDLTLRQMYYQFVARGFIPNKQSEYDRLGNIISRGRLAGLIDWDVIVDRTRNLRRVSTWDNPFDILNTVAEQFRTDKWQVQPYRVEAWIEKDALIGVIEGICNTWEIPHFSCRGYVSQSEMWAAAQRIWSAYEDNKQPTILIHLGDHDPSGIDMSRDILDRLKTFISPSHDRPDEVIKVERIALNMDQVRQYSPPPNPAKLTDSRCENYMKFHGDKSWELDALDPPMLSSLIEGRILDYLDLDRWNRSVAADEIEKETLLRIATKYEGIKQFLQSKE